MLLPRGFRKIVTHRLVARPRDPSIVAIRCQKGSIEMLGWAVTFLIIAIVAGLLGFTGIAGMATQIAWILFVVGLILAVVFLVMGRRPSA